MNHNLKPSETTLMSIIRRRLAIECLFATLILIALIFPLLLRSPWVDEVMLFLNYPLDPFKAFFDPLPYFDQAATPIYSSFWGIFGFLNPVVIRLISAVGIIFFSLYLISLMTPMGRLSPVIYASFALLLFPPAFRMITEMKHYGLEMIACLLVTVWFSWKDSSKPFTNKDLLVLVTSLLLGISTILLAPIGLSIFFVSRFIKGLKPSRHEIVRATIFCLVFFLYYVLIKKIVFYQIENYPDAYRYTGVIDSIKIYLYTLAQLTWGPIPWSLVIFVFFPFFFVLLDSRQNSISRRFLIFVVVVFLSYLFLSVIGLYPVKYVRHVMWFSAFLWLAISISTCNITKILSHTFQNNSFSFIPLIALSFISMVFLKSIWQDFPNNDLSNTHNNAAISYLESMPPSKLNFWIGGETVFNYYLRFKPELQKHSFRDFQPRISALKEFENKEEWDRTKIDLRPNARQELSDIKSGQDFVIFASHFDINSSPENRVKGLHDVLNERGCEYITKDFRMVHIYHVKCIDK